MMTLFRDMDKTSRQVLAILLFVALATSSISAFVGSTESRDWWEGWFQNFSTEVMGAVMTFILFEIVIGGQQKAREKREFEEQEKKRLIRQLGSRVNDEARRAAEELRTQGWLQDGSLQGAELRGANLQSTYLESADLRGVDLRKTSLRGANLARAQLSENTILPNYTEENPTYWTPETDMTRFTNPKHPDFWEPNWAKKQKI